MLWQPARLTLNRSEREGNAPAAPATPEVKPARLTIKEQAKQVKYFDKTPRPTIQKSKLCERKPRDLQARGLTPKAANMVLSTKQRRANRDKAMEEARTLAIAIEQGIGPGAEQRPYKPRVRPSVIEGLFVCICPDACGIGATELEAWKDWTRQPRVNVDKQTLKGFEP